MNHKIKWNDEVNINFVTQTITINDKMYCLSDELESQIRKLVSKLKDKSNE